jgi:hypothetical protein
MEKFQAKGTGDGRQQKSTGFCAASHLFRIFPLTFGQKKGEDSFSSLHHSFSLMSRMEVRRAAFGDRLERLRNSDRPIIFINYAAVNSSSDQEYNAWPNRPSKDKEDLIW